jgi:hypothetical protein
MKNRKKRGERRGIEERSNIEREKRESKSE